MKNLFVFCNMGLGRGRIGFDGRHFANTYTLQKGWCKPGQENWIAFNREGLAIDMGCPVIEARKTVDEIIIE